MKIGFLITARLKSTRLPLKLLLDLNGKSIIERVIERCKKVTDISEIILCTSTNPQDKTLVDVAKKNNIYYYLGSEMDVLKRLSDAAEFYGLEYIINITGENPLFSIHHANLVVDQAKKGKNDFIYIEGLPIGCAVYGIRPEALKTICEIKKEVDTEIWGTLINRPEVFDTHKIEVEKYYNRQELRITTDYLEDYQFIEKIYSLFPASAVPSYHEVINVLSENPDFEKIHKHRTQLALDKEVVQRIDNFFSRNLSNIKEIKARYYK
ncbi:3-deoxy-manno-octulosonate cytidylyltransferase [Balneola sp. EhC07]|uniref:cytidylyltransferase domain-containing protein n=1 Tax=Balneola sp. EhC07 TaxID=1849360 RepID=UPI0007F4A0E5|nr:3-deoxy-manno-octulosonate cytidylyltransferase [Balneola sp. EhC07]OAN60345.1 3-deoxy-manno-octulosonate cytidylyltransferase [Balneola sp. EhC07]